MSETIIGIGIFLDSTQNTGTVQTGVFDDSATNSGVTTNASFSGSATNTGTVVENATFTETAVNDGTVATAVFEGSSTNTGSVTGAVVFTGTAVNNGTVAEAIFLGSSQNGGTVTLSATFAENAGNLATGLIQGDAVFADNTVNAGTIQGNAEIAATANGEQGTVAGSVTTYTQPDGAFAYGYFSGGVKAAAPSYATIVYQVGSFWYKYDASGNGALATGNYNDGTSLFTFVNGVKGSAYNAPTDAPTDAPTNAPTNAPTDAPTNAPTDAPTNAPTDAPTNAPGNWYDDESASAHVVTFDGTQSSEGAVFDGNDQLTVPSSQDFAFGTGDFTIEGWVKQSNGDAQDWFVLGDSSNESNRIQFKFDGSNITYVNSTNFNMPYSMTLLVNNWYHVALSRASNVSRIYIDGVNVVGAYNDNYDYTANDFRMGDQLDGGNALSGVMAGVRVIKGAGLYTGSSYPVPSALPTATNETVLLLNFGASAVPVNNTDQNTPFNTTDGSYTPYNSLFYTSGAPYTGTLLYGPDGYGDWLNQVDFVNGVEVYRGPRL
jgi:hypothetical protein